ncbi:uncharacterized protein LOC131629293 [Vicia villosa]|uniref:uncharacterized protein LOC131629293 n=1 Tax=Vicia villosa TaxID=3911 RepID=UPI00273B0D93|nr:uncharacterized protein LOC131629293 [Vicia villosa]
MTSPFSPRDANNTKVFTLDARKAKGNTKLAARTCYVNNQPLFVLDDCGATHSFISNQRVKRLGFEASLLPNPMIISSATDDIVDAQKICKDWLSANSIYIGCKEKAIFIPAEENTPIDVIGNLIEGTFNMVNYLLAQEKSFLLILTTKSEDKKNVSEIPIVCEFPDVFPEDVTSLQP